MFCAGREAPRGASRARDLPGTVPWLAPPPRTGSEPSPCQRRAWGRDAMLVSLVNRTLAALKGLYVGHFDRAALALGTPRRGPHVALSRISTLGKAQASLLERMIGFWQEHAKELPRASTMAGDASPSLLSFPGGVAGVGYSSMQDQPGGWKGSLVVLNLAPLSRLVCGAGMCIRRAWMVFPYQRWILFPWQTFRVALEP